MPGVVCGAVAGLVAMLLTAGWYGFEDGGCGSPTAKFACLVESLVAAAAAVVLAPVAVGLGYRAAGVRRPLPSVLVAGAVAFCLLALPVLLQHVSVLAGTPADPTSRVPASGVGLLSGLAVLGGGLALQGPRRRWRGAAAVVALTLLAGATLLLEAPADRAGQALRLDRARVPLLLPDGWQPYRVHVGPAGELRYDAVPVGWPGYGFEGLDVSISRRADAQEDTCGFRRCATAGDITYEVPEEQDSGVQAWRVVGGHEVSARASGHADHLPALDPVAALRGMRTVTAEEWLQRRFTDR